MKCPVCNADLPSTAKFCGGCGTTLSAAPPPAARAIPEVDCQSPTTRVIRVGVVATQVVDDGAVVGAHGGGVQLLGASETYSLGLQIFVLAVVLTMWNWSTAGAATAATAIG